MDEIKQKAIEAELMDRKLHAEGQFQLNVARCLRDIESASRRLKAAKKAFAELTYQPPEETNYE